MSLTPSACPPRTSLYTGLMPSSLRVRMNGTPLDWDVPTIFQSLADEGYAMHVVREDSPWTLAAPGSCTPSAAPHLRPHCRRPPDLHSSRRHKGVQGHVLRLELRDLITSCPTSDITPLPSGSCPPTTLHHNCQRRHITRPRTCELTTRPLSAVSAVILSPRTLRRKHHRRPPQWV